MVHGLPALTNDIRIPVRKRAKKVKVFNLRRVLQRYERVGVVLTTDSFFNHGFLRWARMGSKPVRTSQIRAHPRNPWLNLCIRWKRGGTGGLNQEVCAI
jgi:hypothetical protein